MRTDIVWDRTGESVENVEDLPTDDELKPAQLAAMQSLDDARRAGQITATDFRTIEVVIRQGHVHGARKRLTAARRRRASTS